MSINVTNSGNMPEQEMQGVPGLFGRWISGDSLHSRNHLNPKVLLHKSVFFKLGPS